MRTYLLFALLPLLQISFSQEIQTELISETSLQADKFIGVDVLDNIYYIKDNVLYKKIKDNILSYSNVKYGNIYSVNIQNPFKIILFFKDFNSIVLLDNQLNELTPTITFPGNNLSLVGYSSENKLWLYSRNDNTLKMFDYQNNQLELSSQPLSFYQNNFIAHNLYSDNDKVWLSNGQGILQFDTYLNFTKFIESQDVQSFFPYKKGVLIFNDSGFYFLNDNLKTPIALDMKYLNKGVYFNKGILFFLANDILYKYQIK